MADEARLSAADVPNQAKTFRCSFVSPLRDNLVSASNLLEEGCSASHNGEALTSSTFSFMSVTNSGLAWIENNSDFGSVWKLKQSNAVWPFQHRSQKEVRGSVY